MKPSGRLVVRLNPELHQQLQQEARRRGSSLNSLIVERCKLPMASHQLPAFVPEICKEYGNSVLGVVVFGSQVRGDATNSSDLDLLIVLDSQLVISRSLYRVWDERVAAKVDAKISPQFVHLPFLEGSEIGSLWLEVSLEGEVVYDKAGKVREAIRKIRGRIASGEYMRKTKHGHPYWIKNKVGDEK